MEGFLDGELVEGEGEISDGEVFEDSENENLRFEFSSLEFIFQGLGVGTQGLGSEV